MGHGNHWDALEGDVERTVARIIPMVLDSGKIIDSVSFQYEPEDGPPRIETAHAFEHPPTPLRFMALVATDSSGPETRNFLFSAYPFCADGCVNRIRFNEAVDWCNPIEGIVHGTFNDCAHVSFFDVDYYKNGKGYEPGKEYDFAIAGIAYRLQKTVRNSIVVSEGPLIDMERKRRLAEDPNADVEKITSVELSLKDLRCLLPQEQRDDAEFQTVVETVDYLDVEGIRLCRIRATLMIPDDKPFDAYIYASEAVLNDYRPQKGDSIQGIIWLQGRLVSDNGSASKV